MTERILVLEGVLDLCLSGIWHQYSAGETVIFSADQPHAYRNSGWGCWFLRMLFTIRK
ncbi:MAG: cupin domain-containing protein [Nitrincola sp.]|nr:cupin domain-containing protein [Nitrincola sp.]